MSISIADLATTDFSDVTTGKQLAPVRPGDILLHDSNSRKVEAGKI